MGRELGMDDCESNALAIVLGGMILNGSSSITTTWCGAHTADLHAPAEHLPSEHEMSEANISEQKEFKGISMYSQLN